MTQLTSTAVVATDRPARYGKQLASHLGRRAESHWDADAGSGWVQFPTGRVELTATPEGLRLVLVGEAADAARWEDVIGRHLVRFASREVLVCAWTRSDGTVGTEYRTPDETPAEADPER